MTKNAERREKFRKIGQAISKIGDPNAPDYETGRDSQFEIKGKAVRDRALSHVVGPKLKTQQWERTIKK